MAQEYNRTRAQGDVLQVANIEQVLPINYSRKGDRIFLGLTFAGLAVGSLVGSGINYHYARGNTEAIERTVEADGMRYEAPLGRRNGVTLHERVTGMRVGVGQCMVSGVSAVITRDKKRDIIDTSHYQLARPTAASAVSTGEHNDIPLSTPEPQLIYRFENGADLLALTQEAPHLCEDVSRG